MAVSRRRIAFGALGLVVALLAVLAPPAHRHVRAAGLMARFVDAGAAGRIAAYGRHAITEVNLPLPGAEGQVPARLYTPQGEAHAPCMVLAHGVHRLGIEEPRLKGFSRAIASAGVTVLTPEVRELADYRIDPKSIPTLRMAARELRKRCEDRRVGMMGMSFAGGLAVMSAATPEAANDVAFVASIGGHDELGRVLKFFVTNEIERPDGTVEKLQAHDYGPLVLVYSHIEGFFPPEDAAVAQEALRYWLWEQFDTAKDKAKALGPASYARMAALFEHKLETIRPELNAEIERRKAQFPLVSPSSCLAEVRVPIYLLHGAGDNVIPATETLWLARHAPADRLQQALVSKAISHVELQGKPGLWDELLLVHFMAGLLDEMD
jgi:dienelactone hydrolase